jgi:hypothetical protein
MQRRVVSFLVTALFAAPAQGSDLSGGSEDRPVVLVIELAKRGRGEARTQRFIEELGLTLDGFEVRGVAPTVSEFGGLPLFRQLRDVRPMIEEYRAVAAVWSSAAAPGVLLVHLVALRTGQTLVRTIEAARQPGSESDLALAVRELLGAAWLFVPPEQQLESPAMIRLVESVRDRVTSYGRRYRGGVRMLALAGSVAVKDGLSDFEGPSSEVEIAVALEAELGEGVWTGLGLAATLRPGQTTVHGQIGGWGVTPYLSIAATVIKIDFPIGRLAIGPAGGFGFEWQQVSLQLGTAPETHEKAARLRLWGGLSLRWLMSERVAVILEPRVGWASQQSVYRRQTDNAVVLATPRVDWGFRLGVLYRPF